MKPPKTIALTLLALLPAWIMADENEKTFGDGTLPEIVAVFDLDNSGDLSSEEAQAMRDARRDARNNRRTQVLAEFDLDGDGKLNKEEKEAAQAYLTQKIIEKRAQYFHNADADESGALSKEEFIAIPSVAKLAERRPEIIDAIFNKLDKNKDGVVTLEEFLARFKNP